MALWQGRPKRKVTGGRLSRNRKKRKFEIGPEKQFTVIDDEHRFKSVRTRGGHKKVRVLASDVANVLDPKKNKTKKVEIETVVKNPANPNYVQRNIITKGAVIRTELGLARVTSRPGQDGVLNAVLIEE